MGVAAVAAVAHGCGGNPFEASASASVGGSTNHSSVTDSGLATSEGSGVQTGEPGRCGDGLIDVGEECDAGPENGAGGPCRDDCRFNVCGDRYVGPGEVCDDGNQADDDGCTGVCGPSTCGDGILDPSEYCDDGNTVGGDGCAANCMLPDTCGDGSVNEGEECDLTVDGRTCADVNAAFHGGTLRCSERCTLDVSGCSACGDGVIQSGEQCEGANVNRSSCMAHGYAGGDLTCTAGCQFDFSGCLDMVCGNGLLEDGEQCDLDNIPNRECSMLGAGFDGGLVGCTNECERDLTACCYGNVGDECGGDLPGSCCEPLNCQDGACCIARTGVACTGDSDCCGDSVCRGEEQVCCIDDGHACTGQDDCCSRSCLFSKLAGIGTCIGTSGSEMTRRDSTFGTQRP